MFRRTRFIGAVTVMVVGLVAPPALAHRPHSDHGKHHRAHQFLGTLTSITVTDGVGTATFTSLRGNRAARRWVAEHPGDVTVNVDPRTRFSGPGGLGATAADYRVGDGVNILAFNDAGVLKAKRVRLSLQGYRGTIAAYDGTTMSVNWTDANRVADAWLAAHGNPNPVSVAITSSTRVEREGGGSPQAGDDVKFRARPTLDGTGLEAVNVEAAAPEAPAPEAPAP